MSSANRGATRNPYDHYATPKPMIELFWRHFTEDDPWVKTKLHRVGEWALDPCAGGTPTTGMPYVEVLKADGIPNVDSYDIRPDSPAFRKLDFIGLKRVWAHYTDMAEKPCLIITNPPYDKAMEIIKTALDVVADNGWVVMLLRLNFLGSTKRLPFFQSTPPARIYVHAKRPSFTPDGKTDSTEYAHFCWLKGASHPTTIKVI